MQLKQLCEAPPVDPAVTPYPKDDACEPEPDCGSEREGEPYLYYTLNDYQPYAYSDASESYSSDSHSFDWPSSESDED
jgi:hypothetical protein